MPELNLKYILLLLIIICVLEGLYLNDFSLVNVGINLVNLYNKVNPFSVNNSEAGDHTNVSVILNSEIFAFVEKYPFLYDSNLGIKYCFVNSVYANCSRNDSNVNNDNQLKYVSLSMKIFNSRRTGNLMFTLAALLFVAKKTGRIPVLPLDIPYGWIDSFFNGSSIPRVPNCFLYNNSTSIELSERFSPLIYDPIFENPHTDPTIRDVPILLINGYFQSHKYTVGVETILRSEFSFQGETLREVNNFMSEHKSLGNNINIVNNPTRSNVKTVGLHVRRGDFLVSHLIDNGFTVVDSEYINTTVQYFYETMLSRDSNVSIVFFICSDEINWVQRTLQDLNLSDRLKRAKFVFSPGTNTAFDMCLLSKCDGIITSTGSFTWWAAWLANTTTTYFTGYPRKGSAFGRGFNPETYYEPGWIGFP